MALSQLECMEDGRIGQTIPESRPEFYYSETYRAALDQLLSKGDTAFKSRLREDDAKDFLSAHEIEVIQSTVEKYSTHDGSAAAAPRTKEPDSTSLRSTYWPDASDTELPLLDIGWPNTGFFKGVTRVMVHTHPPKDNGPHIKEVVRKLIQDAHKVVAIVMDLLTDLQILQDLLDAASKRNVPVYIILDSKGAPHFRDMCRRLEVGPQHLQNIRTRILRGFGIDLSFGRIPGSLGNKYMIVDGDKVMFGTYSFSWSSSRMDRNIITVMTGQIVDFFDQDFRELYAISRELNLFKEFSVVRRNTTPSTRVTVATRPSMPVTSRFQVSLGDKGTVRVPAHKYHNPKYLLALGKLPEDISSPQELIDKMEESRKLYAGGDPVEEENEVPETHTPPSSQKGGKGTNLLCVPPKKKKKFFSRSSKQQGAGNKEGGKVSEGNPGPSTTTNQTPHTSTLEDITESPEEPTAETAKKTKSKTKKNKKTKASQSEDQSSESRKNDKKGCVIS